MVTDVNRLVTKLGPQGIAEKYGQAFLKYVFVENGEPNLNNVEWFVQCISEALPLEGNVIDFGCGFGIHSMLFHCLSDGRISNILAIDPNKQKIGTLRLILSDLGIQGISIMVSRGEDLPLRAGMADVIYCNEAISHVEDIQRSLQEMHRVLRNGGRLVISDTKKWNPYSLFFVHLMGHRDENYLSISYARRLLANAGFRHVSQLSGLVAPRNPWRDKRKEWWWAMRHIDPKYVLVAEK